MAKVLAFFAEGTEEIECLTVVDILRRGSVDVELISITENKTLVGSHKITVVCDKTIEEADFETADLLFFPEECRVLRIWSKIKNCLPQ